LASEIIFGLYLGDLAASRGLRAVNGGHGLPRSKN
jgi:hypothetical protein